MIPLFSVNLPPKDILFSELEKVMYEPSPELGYINIGQGPRVDEFEQKFGKFIGNSNVLSLNSGTSALYLALHLIGVSGGSVVTTPQTCMASNIGIILNNAYPIWADIDSLTGNIDPKDVERKIAKDTKAIIVVHWGGQPCDMQAFNYLETKYGIPVIEDAAHAMGAGGMGNSSYVAYSMQAIKHINTLDGGMLAIKNPEQYKRGKLLRWYGIDREGSRQDFRCELDVKEVGGKWHMNDVNATIGILQLDRVKDIVNRHREIAIYYDVNIKNSYITKPKIVSEGSYWLYTLLLESKRTRDDFMNHMTEWGVQVSRVHERNDIHTAFAQYRRNLPGVDEFNSRMVCIPIHVKLSLDDLKHIVMAVNNFGILYSMGL